MIQTVIEAPRRQLLTVVALAGFIAVHLLVALGLWISVQDVYSEYGKEAARQEFWWNALCVMISMMVLLAESILYWRFRTWITYNGWVWAHFLVLLVAWMVIPWAVSQWLLEPDIGVPLVGGEITRENKIRNISSWAVQLIAHGCFVKLLMAAMKRKKTSQLSAKTAESGSDILVDYTDQ